MAWRTRCGTMCTVCRRVSDSLPLLKSTAEPLMVSERSRVPGRRWLQAPIASGLSPVGANSASYFAQCYGGERSSIAIPIRPAPPRAKRTGDDFPEGSHADSYVCPHRSWRTPLLHFMQLEAKSECPWIMAGREEGPYATGGVKFRITTASGLSMASSARARNSRGARPVCLRKKRPKYASSAKPSVWPSCLMLLRV